MPRIMRIGYGCNQQLQQQEAGFSAALPLASVPDTCAYTPAGPGGNPEARNYAADSQKGLRLSCERGEEVGANSTITTDTIQQRGLTIKATYAKRASDCVAMPGFYLFSNSRATQEVRMFWLLKLDSCRGCGVLFAAGSSCSRSAA
jgi:hypothetical protein